MSNYRRAKEGNTISLQGEMVGTAHPTITTITIEGVIKSVTQNRKRLRIRIEGDLEIKRSFAEIGERLVNLSK